MFCTKIILIQNCHHGRAVPRVIQYLFDEITRVQADDMTAVIQTCAYTDV